MNAGPLMPKATAVWMVDNTSLSFRADRRLSAACIPLEVKGIADGEVAAGIKGLDPVNGGQVTREDIERAEKDPAYRMKKLVSKVVVPEMSRRKGPRYTPLSRRQDRPNAILWLVKNHPELKDAAIMRLVGTTKATIAQIRDRTHWNAAQLAPLDPVTLGLTSQIDLDFEVSRAAKEKPVNMDGGQTLMTADVTTAPAAPVEDDDHRPTGNISADSVFAKLKPLQRAADED